MISLPNLSVWISDAALNMQHEEFVVATSNGIWLSSVGIDERKIRYLFKGVSFLSVHYMGNGEYITGGEFGVYLVSVHDGSYVQIWHGENWLQQILVTQDKLVVIVAGNEVSVLSKDGKVFVSQAMAGSIQNVILSKDESFLVVTHAIGLEVWSMSNGSIDFSYRLAEANGYRDILFSHNGKYLVATMYDKRLQYWNMDTNESFYLSGYLSRIEAASFLYNTHQLVTSGTDCVVIWDLDKVTNGRFSPLEVLDTYGVCCLVKCHPYHNYFSAAFMNGNIAIFCTSTYKVVYSLLVEDSPITSLSWCDTGDYLFYGTESGLFSIVDISQHIH